jgi:hypothetical protein
MDDKLLRDLPLILSSWSATKVCILILASLTEVLNIYSEVWSRYVLPPVYCPALRLGGCSMMKILINNLSCIGFVFGVGHGGDIRYRGI